MNIATGLGYYYLLLCLMNSVAALYLWAQLNRAKEALVWVVVSFVFLIMSAFAMSGSPPPIPGPVTEVINGLFGPVTYSVGTTLILVVLFLGREFFVAPPVAWGMFNLSLLAMGLSVTDADFATIVSKPDNVPIVAMVFLLGFFTWLATHRAVENDKRAKQGLEPLEKLDSEKVLVWPDLVYTELICMVALTVVLLVWSIGLPAPLEEPSSTVKTPNPSKAPWYFLGLQEMLVYYDPWMAGVVLPSLIVVGLMAIPFLDFNKKGNGYYTIEERKFSYLVFQFGFLELWVTLIILGTFLRGPNWNFFGPYEHWDVHKVEALNNVNLSEYFWLGLNKGYVLEEAKGTKGLVMWLAILKREAPGILLVLGYFVLLPPLMAISIFRSFFLRMGFVRFMVMSNLFLFMAALPLKMVLRWTVNMKYLIAIPEFLLNF